MPMKKTFLLALMTVCSFGLFAQNFSADKDSIYEDGPATIVKDLYNDILTESSDAITVAWKVTEWDAPSGWNLTICDNKTCIYDPPIDEEFIMMPFKTGDDVFFKVSFTPNKVEGQGVARLWVYDEGNEVGGEELVFVYNSWKLGTVEKEETLFNLYPNPAQNFLRLNFNEVPRNELNVKIFNLLGQEQKDIEINIDRSNVNIDISALRNGNYLLQFVDEKGSLKTERFTKRL